MKWKTYHKVPIEIDLTIEEMENILAETIKNHYVRYVDSLEGDDKEALKHTYEYFTGKPIDYLER